MAAEFEIQKALYGAVSGLGITTYDSAPQQADGGSNAVFPYVEVGEIILSEFDDKGLNGFNFLARVHTRSRSASMKEAKDIQSQMYGRLHNGTLSITGYDFILLLREFSDVTRVADGSFHGVCEYRGHIQQTGD